MIFGYIFINRIPNPLNEKSAYSHATVALEK